MAIKKSELYSSLWASCDELRGSMDASQYKDYVLVMLFMKYVSDKKDPLIEIKEGTSFYDMLKYRGKDGIGDKINTIIGEFAKNNGLSGIVEVDFNDEAKLGGGKDKVDRLTNLLNIFNKPELNFGSNRAEGDDLLGDAYEYLMRHFATESGKSKGQFYTPSEVSRVMAEVVGIRQSKSASETLYDPTCGSGSLLLKAADLAQNGITIYGQENDNATRGLAVMNMWLHNFTDADIKQGNTMASPLFTDDLTGELKRFDYAVANPPFSYKAWMNGLDPVSDIYKRFEGYDAIPPKKNGDFAFLLHIIKSLKADKGKACVVLPLGVLFRGNAEADIRKKLIQKGYIKGIIGLPPNLFYGTGIAASLIIIDKEGAAERTHIFMIDASRGFIKDGNKNRLREQDIHKIVDTFNKRLTVPKYARNVPVAEIADSKNDYNLNIPRYIDSQEAEDIQDIEAHLLGGIPKRDVDALEAYWTVYPSLKQHLFSAVPNRPNYYQLNVANADIKDSIYNHPEFTAFGTQMNAVFAQWRTESTTYAKALDKGIHPKREIHYLSEKLLKQYVNKPLTDQYAMYQHLMDYWAETMQDDFYELAADGWAAGNEVTRIVKKTKKGDKEIEKQVPGIAGLEGRLIPPSLLIQLYFAKEKAEIDDLQIKLETAVSEKTELIEEHGVEEGALQGVSSKKDAESALKEFIVLAMGEYCPNESDVYNQLSKELIKVDRFLKDEVNNTFIANLRNEKGKLNQKAIADRLKMVVDLEERSFLDSYKDASTKKAKLIKTIDQLTVEVFKKLRDKIDAGSKEEYILEMSIIVKYIDLIENEATTKAAIKKAYEQLEQKVITQYPNLSIEEIKTIVVEQKWMAAIEQRIRTEMDNISHRLTQRIRELAERYETPLPELETEVEELEQRVKGHLSAMGF